MGLNFIAKNADDEETIRKWVGKDFDIACHCYHPDRMLLDCFSCLEDLARAVARSTIEKHCKRKK